MDGGSAAQSYDLNLVMKIAREYSIATANLASLLLARLMSADAVVARQALNEPEVILWVESLMSPRY